MTDLTEIVLTKGDSKTDLKGLLTWDYDPDFASTAAVFGALDLSGNEYFETAVNLSTDTDGPTQWILEYTLNVVSGTHTLTAGTYCPYIQVTHTDGAIETFRLYETHTLIIKELGCDL